MPETPEPRPNLAVLGVLPLLPEARAELNRFAGAELFWPDTEPADLPELVARTGQAQAVLVSIATEVDREFFQRCSQVDYVGVCGTSLSNVDLAAAEEFGVTVTNVRDYGDEPTAEFVFMQLVALARGVGPDQWRAEPHELMGKTLTIVGLGALGGSIAHLALAYRMKVRYHSRNRKPEWEARGVTYGELSELLPHSDIVVLTGPTDVELLGQKEFRLLPATSILVQASTGRAFDPDAFLAWIRQDAAHAIFDLSAGEERYQRFSPLPRVTFPKMIAGHSIETRRRLGDLFLQNLHQHTGH